MKPQAQHRADTLKREQGKTYISARFLCERYGIDPELMKKAMERAGLDDNWLDTSAFAALAKTSELSRIFTKPRREFVIHLMWHFYDKQEACPHAAGDPSSCELQQCRCAPTGEVA